MDDDGLMMMMDGWMNGWNGWMETKPNQRSFMDKGIHNLHTTCLGAREKVSCVCVCVCVCVHMICPRETATAVLARLRADWNTGIASCQSYFCRCKASRKMVSHIYTYMYIINSHIRHLAGNSVAQWPSLDS